MSTIDWTALSLGIAVGMAVSAIYFAGLAFGMKRALRADNLIGTLVLSTALRIAMFLGVGWLVTAQGGPWAFAGYGLAFFISRRIATTWAKVSTPARGAQ